MSPLKLFDDWEIAVYHIRPVDCSKVPHRHGLIKGLLFIFIQCYIMWNF